MLEEQCRGVFYNACKDVVDNRAQVIKLKGWPRPKNEFEDYLRWDSKFYKWDGWLVKRCRDQPKTM